jgi:putative ABC transport system substrate-binding protein
MAKRLELLKDSIPRIRRVAVLVKRDNPLFGATLPVLYRAADELQVELQEVDARDPSEFESAMTTMGRNGAEGMIVQEDAVYLTNRKQIVDLAMKHLLPVASSGEFAETGALIGYGVDFHEMCKLAALFVDKILRGARPGELPVDRATKFETVFNVKVARTLGLPLPALALLRADRIIE